MDDFILEDDDSFQREDIISTDTNLFQDDDNIDYSFRELSDSQKTILAALPIPSAILSIFGSSVIIYMSYMSKRERPWTPYNRLLVAMSVYDIISSLALGLAAFMNNKETSNKAWAMGNDSTCSVIGLFNQIAYSGVLYNASLSYYFLFSARFGMNNEEISQCIEPTMHIFNIGFPMMTAFVGLILGVYSESEMNLGCWVNRYPKNCDYGPDGTGQPCLSGQIGWVFGGWIGFFTIFSLIINNFVIWKFARQQIKRSLLPRSVQLGPASAKTFSTEYRDEELSQSGRSEKSAAQGSLSSSMRTKLKPSDRSSQKQISIVSEEVRASQRRRLRLLRSQAFLFVVSCFVCNVLSYVLKYIESQSTSWVQEKELPLEHYYLLVFNDFLLPLQGLLNMMVYIRPKLLNTRHEFPKESWKWVLRRAIWGSKVDPIHSLMGAVEVQHKDGSTSRNKVTRVVFGKDMVSSLTNASEIVADESSVDTSARQRYQRRRSSTTTKRSGASSLGIISEIPDPSDQEYDDDSYSLNDLSENREPYSEIDASDHRERNIEYDTVESGDSYSEIGASEHRERSIEYDILENEETKSENGCSENVETKSENDEIDNRETNSEEDDISQNSKTNSENDQRENLDTDSEKDDKEDRPSLPQRSSSTRILMDGSIVEHPAMPP